MDSVQIHGFCDASKAAYYADKNSQYLYKSKAAHIQTVCLMRLELNGAVLLAK